ncbi:hypothetical protein B0H10DRAFT_2193993 [Mycena sp. CBHHK59/15]|nr:hypothetical protein B0H10DRAFT_2193993 [Mycena sp. CBHHK59/15]
MCGWCGLHCREGHGSRVGQQKGMCAVTMQQRHTCPRLRKGGTASTLFPCHLVLQSTAAEFHISHQSAAAVVWTVREVHAHLAAQFGGASAFGVPCLRTYHARLREALNVWPHWATPIKIGSGGAAILGQPNQNWRRHHTRVSHSTAETHHNRLKEALNVWPYWATPIKIGGGAADPFRVVCSKSQHHRLGEVLNNWSSTYFGEGAYLANPSKLVAAARAHSTSGARKDTAEVEELACLQESKIQEHCLDGIVEWDHGDIVNWVTTGQWRGEMGMWELHERVVTNAKRKCTEKESQ